MMIMMMKTYDDDYNYDDDDNADDHDNEDDNAAAVDDTNHADNELTEHLQIVCREERSLVHVLQQTTWCADDHVSFVNAFSLVPHVLQAKR